MTLTIREQRIRPWSDANRASLERRSTRPHDLLRWYLEGFRAEMPERISSHRVNATGLGLAEEFRSYMEDNALEEARLTEDGIARVDEAYRFPMRTALRALAGRRMASEPYPFMAHVLYLVACMGDVDAACASLGIVRPVRWPYVMLALERLYERYLDAPRPQLVRGGYHPRQEHPRPSNVNSAVVARPRGHT